MWPAVRIQSSRSKAALISAKLALSGVAIVAILAKVDIPSTWHRMLFQNLWLALLAAAVMIAQIALGGVRWNLIVHRLGGDLPMGISLRLFYIAVFFNACLWGAVAGDVVRAWLAQRFAVGTRVALNSVLLDRIAPLCAVALLMLSTLPLLVARVGVAAAMIPSALSIAGLLTIPIIAQLHRLPQKWRRNTILRFIQSLGMATGTIFLVPSAAVPILSVAILAQIGLSLATYIIARSLAIDIGPLDCLMLMQPVALITALPISIGGWGVREVTMVMLLGLIGVSSEAALALSVQIGLINLIVSLPGGLLWIFFDFREAVVEPRSYIETKNTEA